MANPIEVIIVKKESASGGDGIGCLFVLMIVAIGLVIKMDIGFATPILIVIILFGAIACEWKGFFIVCLIIFGGMWGWKKLKEQDKDTNEDKSERISSVDNATQDMPLNPDLPRGNRSGRKTSPVMDLAELSSIDYPSSFLTTSDSQFLSADGKENVIPANTRILILKRTPTGMLTLEVNGKTYLGYDSRLNSGLMKAD